MIFSKEILNCSEGVIGRIDTSKEKVREALSTNSLRMDCGRINWIVGLDSDLFLGTPLNVACTNDKCEFYRKKVNLTSPAEKDKLGQG